MRKAALALTAIAILTGFTACKRTIRDSGCITRYSGPDIPSTLKPGQLDTIRQLFAANNIPLDGKQFIGYRRDSQKLATGEWVAAQYASAQLSYNSLPVFYAIWSWSFRDGLYVPGYSNQPQYADPGDPTPHLTLAALRQIFFRVYEDSLYTGKFSPHSPTKARPVNYYHDTCLAVQLGYLDTYYEPPYNKDFGKNIVLAWRITPADPNKPSSAPVVFVEDRTGYAFCQILTYPGQPTSPYRDPIAVD